jgi:hypothetical protein
MEGRIGLHSKGEDNDDNGIAALAPKSKRGRDPRQEKEQICNSGHDS